MLSFSEFQAMFLQAQKVNVFRDFKKKHYWFQAMFLQAQKVNVFRDLKKNIIDKSSNYKR